MFRLILIGLAILTPVGLAQQQEEIRYSYDRNGRLTRVDYGGGRAINYKYDAAGRLIQRVVEAPEPAPSNEGPKSEGKRRAASAAKK